MKRILMALLVVAQTGVALAAPTPETLVRADVRSREVTLDGMQMQINLRRQSASNDVLTQAAIANQERVEAAFATFGFTGASHSAEWTRQSAAVTEWLAAHAEWRQTYADLNARFQSLSQQIHSLRAAQ